MSELAGRDFKITIKYLKTLQEMVNKIDEETENFRRSREFVEKHQMEILELKNMIFENL